MCSYLAKILVPEGSKDVLVGQPIAITVQMTFLSLYLILLKQKINRPFYSHCLNFLMLFLKVEDLEDIKNIPAELPKVTESKPETASKETTQEAVKAFTGKLPPL